MAKRFARLALSLAVFANAGAAMASSDGAWDAFRKDVETACLKAAAGSLDGASAIVDPFGSESFGLALLRGKAKGGKQPVMMICVYDKKQKTVEIGSELQPPK